MNSETKIIGGILLLSLALVAAMVLVGGKMTTKPVKLFEPIKVEQAELVRPEAPTLGSADAPVTIIEFADFQCPACAQTAPVLIELLTKYEGQVRLVYRHFPLVTTHDNAFLAAQAAEAAGRQEKFWVMNELLYARQKEWSALSDARERFTSYATELNLDQGQFVADLDHQELIDRIRLGLGDSEALGLTSTPTLFINGQRQDGLSSAALEAAIQAALAKPTVQPRE